MQAEIQELQTRLECAQSDLENETHDNKKQTQKLLQKLTDSEAKLNAVEQ